MEHSHNHRPHRHPGNSRDECLLGTMVLNLIIPADQIYGGTVSGSMALISDALHNLSDFTSVAISYTALRLGRQKPTMQQTFGYKRFEVFAALFNVALLYVVGFFIALENWQRFQHSRPVEEIHHLHVWVSAESVALTAHIVVPDQMRSNIDGLSEAVRRLLREKFRIDHPILQFEARRHNDTGLLCRMEAGGTMDCR